MWRYGLEEGDATRLRRCATSLNVCTSISPLMPSTIMAMAPYSNLRSSSKLGARPASTFCSVDRWDTRMRSPLPRHCFTRCSTVRDTRSNISSHVSRRSSGQNGSYSVSTQGDTDTASVMKLGTFLRVVLHRNSAMPGSTQIVVCRRRAMGSAVMMARWKGDVTTMCGLMCPSRSAMSMACVSPTGESGESCGKDCLGAQFISV
mmetsp:Transcript_26807/g.67396  ORF Transcript_26807/g.67396 Transcript_26807/m.67396 type:complete len:204 (+) Transcript_26807:164-775(+)